MQEELNQEIEQVDAESEQSRREFITKLVTTAGAVAVAGLAAGAAGAPASADIGKLGPEAIVIKGETTVHKGETVVDKTDAVSVGKWDRANIEALKLHKGADGFRIVMSGAQVGQALQAAGILRPGVNLANSKITIEFSAE